MRKLVLQQAAISLDGYICGEGTAPLFPDPGRPHGLRLLSSRVFQCGVLALTYRPMTQQELSAIVPVPDTGKQSQDMLDASRAEPT